MNVPKYESFFLPVSNFVVFILLQEYNTNMMERKELRNKKQKGRKNIRNTGDRHK
jgi:hypothetical protein